MITYLVPNAPASGAFCIEHMKQISGSLGVFIFVAHRRPVQKFKRPRVSTLLPWNNHFHTSEASLKKKQHDIRFHFATQFVPPLKEVLYRLRMYGYSMAIVLDHRSSATSLTGN